MKILLSAAALALLAGCAAVAPDGLRGDAAQLAAGAGVPRPSTADTVDTLLAGSPLTAEAAVRIALLNNP